MKFSRNHKLNALCMAIYIALKENGEEYKSGINYDALYCTFNNVSYYEGGCIGYVYTEDARDLLVKCGYKADKMNYLKVTKTMINACNYVCYMYAQEVAQRTGQTMYQLRETYKQYAY